MARGSFQLHKWIATPPVASALGVELKHGQTSCLGVNWDLDSDQIGFEIPKLADGELTRRKLASVFAKYFDPLGLLGPFHTRIKGFFKELIIDTKEWDQLLSAELTVEAQALADDLAYLADIKVNRLVRTSTTFELWLFGDASSFAYGICIYVFDTSTKQSHCSCHTVMSLRKTRPSRSWN